MGGIGIVSYARLCISVCLSPLIVYVKNRTRNDLAIWSDTILIDVKNDEEGASPAETIGMVLGYMQHTFG